MLAKIRMYLFFIKISLLGHKSHFNLHQGMTKIYKDFKELFVGQVWKGL